MTKPELLALVEAAITATNRDCHNRLRRSATVKEQADNVVVAMEAADCRIVKLADIAAARQEGRREGLEVAAEAVENSGAVQAGIIARGLRLRALIHGGTLAFASETGEAG